MKQDRFGVLDAVFSMKCFAAAMLAYYIALRIPLSRPSWAVVTTYIVSQPLAGAVLSKAFFRVLGTALGGTMAVILVPNLANAPELLSLALALWLGLCVYYALLDRTPRSYIFLLAGYTASIIGFPSVSAPGAIFTTAILRVQEITLGIVCASLFHGVLLPRTVASRLVARVDAVLADAERWSADALSELPAAELARERHRLAFDIFDMHQLSVHLPFDVARLVPRVSVVRALQDQISLLLPLGAACLDRITQLRPSGPLPAEIDALLEDVRCWLSLGAPADQRADALIARAAQIEPAPSPSWSSALTANLVARLAELIEAHAACTALRARLLAPPARDTDPHIDAILRRAGRRPLHRDHSKALRCALAVSVAAMVLCTVWIAAAWPDGANAVLIAGAVGAVLASVDATPALGRRLLVGAFIATLICCFYDFVILPRVTDFVPLAAVLAPAFLLMGGMMTWPQTAPYALGMVVTLPISIGLGDRYDSSFAAFVNGNMAQLVGMAAPVVTLSLFATIGGAARARRVLRITRRELARRCLAPGRPRTERWLATVLDRVAYLYPQVARGEASTGTLDQILLGTRIGLNIDELRLLRSARGTSSREAVIDTILQGLHDHLRTPAPAPDDEALRRRLDALLTDPEVLHAQEPDRRLSHAVVGLRRSLFPNAQAPALEAPR